MHNAMSSESGGTWTANRMRLSSWENPYQTATGSWSTFIVWRATVSNKRPSPPSWPCAGEAQDDDKRKSGKEWISAPTGSLPVCKVVVLFIAWLTRELSCGPCGGRFAASGLVRVMQWLFFGVRSSGGGLGNGSLGLVPLPARIILLILTRVAPATGPDYGGFYGILVTSWDIGMYGGQVEAALCVGHWCLQGENVSPLVWKRIATIVNSGRANCSSHRRLLQSKIFQQLSHSLRGEKKKIRVSGRHPRRLQLLPANNLMVKRVACAYDPLTFAADEIHEVEVDSISRFLGPFATYSWPVWSRISQWMSPRLIVVQLARVVGATLSRFRHRLASWVDVFYAQIHKSRRESVKRVSTCVTAWSPQ